MAGAIVDAAKRLGSQLGELQDTLRLRSGTRLDLATEPTDLVALARAAASDAPVTPQHRIAVAAAEPEVWGRWDALRIRRVLDNIVGNAVKYSPAGGDIIVAVSREGRDDGARAAVAVRDAGIGIPAADLAHLFERYRRGSNVGSRIAGTGIGLAGAKQIVEQHGGTIAVESAEGMGTIVTVELPLDPIRSEA
jgi:signal transduction histidine kinase